MNEKDPARCSRARGDTIMDIEFVHITKDTTVESLEHDLFLSDLAWKLK